MRKWIGIVLCAGLSVGIAEAQQQQVISVLEVCDATTGERTVVKEFPYLIEAPNWTVDGQWLIYNSGGQLYKLSPDQPGEPQRIESGYATRCNNDHVLSADGQRIAISHGTKEDGRSRIYTLPISGGTPQLVTPMAPPLEVSLIFIGMSFHTQFSIYLHLQLNGQVEIARADILFY